MKLYHYSDKLLKCISPDYYGSNSWTSKESDNHKFSFFYGSKFIREKFFRMARYRYTVDVNEALIYDTYEDPLGLYRFYTFDKMIQHLEEYGFIGLSFNPSDAMTIYCLFHTVNIESIEVF